MHLHTDRLLIRNFHAADWEALHAVIAQYAASELSAYDQQWPTSPEEIRKIAEWFAGGDSHLAVCLRESGRLIGFVALSPEPAEDERAYNLGYVFGFEYHGRGYATEACRALLQHAFEHLPADRVVTGTAAANRASCRLLERLGFEWISETTTSFATAPDGAPIEFLGYTYELTANHWRDRDLATGCM